MASVDFSQSILPFLVWQFFIPLGAGWAQTILYSIFIRAGDPKPQPGSPRFIKHRRQILMAIYVAYFAFTIYEVDYELQRSGHLYSDLGVPLAVEDAALQSRFRKLTVRFHPDKVGPSIDREKANDFYVYLKHARDIIADPVKRFAYDRFGPSILNDCPKCLTVHEYTDHAALTIAVTYGAWLAILVGANALGFFKDGSYWRYWAILAIGTYELRTALRSDYPPFLTQFINPLMMRMGWRPPYLPFQATAVLRKSVLSAAHFLGLLIPLYRDDPQQPTKPTDDTDDARHTQLDRLDSSVKAAALDAGRLLELESIPFRENQQGKADLRQALKKFMVQNVVHARDEVRNAMGQSLVRRRIGVPAGARGNR